MFDRLRTAEATLAQAPPPAAPAPTAAVPQRAYLEPAWKLHSLYRELIDAPPPGWAFVLPDHALAAAVGGAGRRPTVHAIKRRLINPLLPANLVKSLLEAIAVRPPAGICLTFASQHVVMRREPWVVDVEHAYVLAGGALRSFGLWARVVRKALESPWCRAVLPWSDAAATTIGQHLPSEAISRKTHVVRLARRPNKGYVKPPRLSGAPFRILFVNSANIPGQFEIKGGREVVAVYEVLRSRGYDVELVLRTEVPSGLRRRVADDPRVIILDRLITNAELEAEFARADVFLLPSHLTPGMAILDAMSYELPVVTIEAFANGELVEDGVTGRTVARAVSEGVDDFYRDPRLVGSRPPDAGVIQRLVEGVIDLIDHPESARRFGLAGRASVETGKFSIGARNDRLAGVLANAVMEVAVC